MITRPLRNTSTDAQAVRALSDAAFRDLLDLPEAAEQSPEQQRAEVRELARIRHLVQSDPAGCWVAEQGGDLVGAALSARREEMWMLSLLVVRPSAQGQGVGRMLLERAAAYGRGCLRGMIGVSPSPAAARRYRLAGFTLHPAMTLKGKVDRTGLLDPGDIPVHRGNSTHLHLLDSVDRRVRGAAHGVDHGFMLAHYEELLIADSLAGSGYCYRDAGRVPLIAATSKRIATRLLREALARVPDGAQARLDFLTAEQEWALDVGLEVGLTISTEGYLALRGMRPPMPYLPSGAFL